MTDLGGDPRPRRRDAEAPLAGLHRLRLHRSPGWEAPLARLAQRHEVLAVWLRDPREEELPPIGPLVLEDAETGEQVYVDTRDTGFQAALPAAGGGAAAATWSARSPATASTCCDSRRTATWCKTSRRFAHLRRERGGEAGGVGSREAMRDELSVAAGAGLLLIVFRCSPALYVWMQQRRRKYALRYASVSLVRRPSARAPASGATSRRRSTCSR